MLFLAGSARIFTIRVKANTIKLVPIRNGESVTRLAEKYPSCENIKPVNSSYIVLIFTCVSCVVSLPVMLAATASALSQWFFIALTFS